jgi:hypothetical protein
VYDYAYLKNVNGEMDNLNTEELKTVIRNTASDFVKSKLLCNNPEEILKLQALYGRPAWNLTIRNFNVIEVGMSKLLGGIDFRNLVKLSQEQYLAILHCRFNLTISAVSELSVNLTARYCSTCLSIQANNTEVYQMYCPDPVLFEAAAHLMHEKFFKLEDALKMLYQFIRKGVVDAGFRGELTAKLLLQLGMDCALQSSANQSPEDAGKKNVFSKFISVKQFLKSTFGDSPLSIIGKQGDEAQVDRLLNGKLFFNAFYYCSYKPDRKDLMVFLSKGLAVICQNGYQSTDFIIPVLIEDDISFILVQVKNIVNTDVNYRFASATLRPSKNELVDEKFNLPYLGIWLSLNYQRQRIVDLQYTEGCESDWPGALPKVKENKASKQDNNTEMVPKSVNYEKIPTKEQSSSNLKEERKDTLQSWKELFPKDPNQFLFGVFGIGKTVFPFLNAESLESVNLLRNLIVNFKDIRAIDEKFADFVDQSTYPMYSLQSQLKRKATDISEN